MGNATAVIQNATFNCVPRIFIRSQAAGLAPGVLAAAIAVPVAVAAAAGLLLWLCLRRRRQRRARHQPDKPSGVIELGRSGNVSGPDLELGSRGQPPQGVMLSADKVSWVQSTYYIALYKQLELVPRLCPTIVCYQWWWRTARCNLNSTPSSWLSLIVWIQSVLYEAVRFCQGPKSSLVKPVSVHVMVQQMDTRTNR